MTAPWPTFLYDEQKWNCCFWKTLIFASHFDIRLTLNKTQPLTEPKEIQMLVSSNNSNNNDNNNISIIKYKCLRNGGKLIHIKGKQPKVLNDLH